VIEGEKRAIFLRKRYRNGKDKRTVKKENASSITVKAEVLHERMRLEQAN